MPRKLIEPIKKFCPGCNKQFFSSYIDKKWCSTSCRTKHNNSEPKWKNITANCAICNKEYLKDTHNKIYCSPECREVANVDNKKKAHKTYKHLKDLKKKELSKLKNSVQEKYITTFNDIRFYKEVDFEHWFKNNFNLFGIKRLIKIDVWYPDVIAELYNGNIIRIELELNASNFISHKHDPSKCELIISFVRREKETHIKGVPVISLFIGKFNSRGGNTDYDPSSLKLTDYFINLTKNFENQINQYSKKNKIQTPDESEINGALEWKNKG